MSGPRPTPWWDALDRHREVESVARHHGDDALAKRVDELESWRDELRGAMSTVRLLIGSNLLLALATIVAIVGAWK